MKWIKSYEVFNETAGTGYDIVSRLVRRAFNVLFNPLGLILTENINSNDDVVLSFIIEVNFGKESKANTVFGPLLSAMYPKSDTTDVHPTFRNGMNLSKTIVEFYKEWSPLGNLFDRERMNGSEIRTFKKHIINGEAIDDVLIYIIYCVNTLFDNISDSIHIESNELIEIPLFKKVILDYTKFIKISTLDITEPPKELYKFVSDSLLSGLGNYKKEFQLLKNLKKTPLYTKLKTYGSIDPEILKNGEQMGELGF